MYKRTLIYMAFITATVMIATSLQPTRSGVAFRHTIPVDIHRQPRSSLLLVPLDSRPPCTQFVEQLARIAGVSVVEPPADLLDRYQQPADRQAIRSWFLENAKNAKTAIVSVDMLLHGGLLASRLSIGSANDIAAVIELFKQAKAVNPLLQIHAFSIIPRLIIADTPENMYHQKNMLDYSVQKDILLTFENPLTYKKLQKLEKQLPGPIIERYSRLYEQNDNLNRALIDLVQQGVLETLVIGQDDGQSFGMPNMVKTSVNRYIETIGLTDKVFVTRGTDEVALTVLGRVLAARAHYSPHVYVRYSHPEAPSIVMPFMPHSVETTIREKLRMVGGIRVASPDEADFTLFVHVGTRHMGELLLDQSAKDIKAMLTSGRRMAVVDLTEDYFATETLFPSLLKQEVPLLQLSAYAGWNTTSNSLGTALAQIAILGSIPPAANEAEALAAWSANTEFLLCRFFDDWYFQKDVQPSMNASLKKQGADPYHLGDLQPAVSAMIQKKLNERAQYWFYRQVRNRPVTIAPGNQPFQALIAELSFAAELPWERTFEIRLEPHMTVKKVQ